MNGEKTHDDRKGICNENGSDLHDRDPLAEIRDCARGVFRRSNAAVDHLAHPDRGAYDYEDAEVWAKTRKRLQARVKKAVEKIDPLALSYVLFIDKRRLPQLAGVYFVIEENDEITYIGKSSNIRNRWRGIQHKMYRRFADRLFVRIAWFKVARNYSSLIRTRGYDYLEELERQLIMRFNPRLNGKPGKPTKKGKAK